MSEQVKTALVIAAGRGSRLADRREIPKPIRNVGGLPLLKRNILSAARAGIEKFYVVVGFEKEKIIDYLSQEKWPISVETIDNSEWEKSNGVSVLKAKDFIKDNFILLMSDHIFDPNTLVDLAKQPLESDGVAAKLAIDYKIDTIFDMDDATKVLVDDHGKIQKIGKMLEGYNAIDTGMFLLSPQIFEYIEKVYLEQGDASLSDGIQALSSQDRMGTYDIGEAYWQDVDDKKALKHAEKVLLRSCRKETDGFISRNFNRYISLWITSKVLKTPLTANMVTFLTTLVGFFSGFFAAHPDSWSYFWGAFLFKWTSILDGVDGEMSRIRLTDSKWGQWFDTISDNLTYVIFILATAWHVWQRPELNVPDVIPYAALFGLVMLLLVMFGYVLFLTDSGSLLAVQKNLVGEKEKAWWQGLASRIYFVIKRDFFATLFLVLAVFGKPHWILFLIALATNVAWIVVTVQIFNSKKA